jgi:hypothetical protein
MARAGRHGIRATATPSRLRWSIGAELADLLPNAEQLNPWKGPEHLDEQCERVIGFLEKHTP